MRLQRLYGGVRLLPDRLGPCPSNIHRIDKGATPMIMRMVQRGLQVDLAHFASMDIELTKDMDRVTEEVHTLTGHYLNLGSGDQVAELLFKTMGLKQAKLKMTPTGERESVEDEVLTAIQHEHPVVGLCLEYKEYEKLRGTYVRPMPKLAKKVGKIWRMFPNFRTTRVPTGRFSTSDPNLLAMPTRTDRGREIRKGFITDPGWVIVSVDFSQIEPRVAAHRSGDPTLIKVYENQEDIYSDFAISAFRLADKRYKDQDGWHYPGVGKMEHRRPAKVCVLASLYSVTASGLQDQMPVICAGCGLDAFKHTCSRFVPLWTENRCQDLINSFYQRYSGLIRMQLDDHTYMRRHAYMVDMWGRILHTTAARSVLEWVVNGALREGANFPIQGAAAGILKLAMASCFEDMEFSGVLGDALHFLLPVHDEIIAEVREDIADEVLETIKYRFETCVELAVPIKASGSKANSWGNLPK